MFPININNSHWALITADIENKTINSYDSMYSISAGVENRMRLISYLLDEYLDRNNFKTDNLDWIFNFVQCTRQENTYDCGVFVCKFMDYLSRNKEITFTQKDMNYYRILIGCELIHETILSK